jgi:hypothetical protein
MYRYFFIIKLVEDSSYEVERDYIRRYISEETVSWLESLSRRDMVTTYDMDKFILTVAFVGEGY